MSRVEQRIHQLGLVLPRPQTPSGMYVPWVQAGHLVFLSGQIAQEPAGIVVGRVGETARMEDAQRCAQLIALQLVSTLKTLPGGLDSVKRVVKLLGMVHATQDFTTPQLVINHASAVFIDIWGDAGRHARSAVCVAQLPFGAPVEIEAIVEVE